VAGCNRNVSRLDGFAYTYDADGNRVEKSNGSTGTIYFYSSIGIVAESDLSGNPKSEYVFFNGERVARKDFPGNTVSYYFSDHLKTASVIADSSGNVKQDEDYYPWGSELQLVNNDSNHYKFTSKERDAESGLDYFEARYYENALGRFVTPDWSQVIAPIPYADLGDPQSLNLYSYVRNAPTSRADPNGHCTADGEKHNVLWCIGHAMGLTHTQKEYQAIVDTRRQWLINNVAKSKNEIGFLRAASNDQISALYFKWEDAIQKAICGWMGCEILYEPTNFRRAENGALVLYRGGDFSNVKESEFKLDANGNVKAGETGRGPSVNIDPKNIPPRFADNITEVKFIPPELTVRKIGGPGHFEIVPREPMAPSRFLQLLKEIITKSTEEPIE
jgi:RHS repeat-associated protein